MSSSADATPPQDDNFLVVFLVIIMVVLVGLGLCLRTVVREHLQAASIGAAGACGSPVTHGCLLRQHGIVESADDSDVSVAYDDGRQTVGLGSVGYTSYPERGTKVVLESWNGTFVSAFDAVSEHRYRGSHWPKAWNDGAIFGIVATSALLVLVGWAAVNEYVTRRRRATL